MPRTAATERSWLTLAVLFVAGITVLRVVGLWLVDFELSGDEAQYWLWAKEPNFGYYSKPPLLAWAIALTTFAGGETEPWVRLSAPLFHAGTAMALFAVGRLLFGPRAGFWAALLFATLPAVWLGSLLVSTDTPLLCFYALALAAFVAVLRAPADGSSGYRWMLFGLALGLALLSKYAAVYLVLGLALALVAVPAWRQAVHPLRALGALALAVLVLAPNLWWNWSTGFVTVGHTADNANLRDVSLHPLEMGNFLASQLAVFGPVAFPLLLCAIGASVAGRSDPARPTAPTADLRALALVSLPPLAAMTLLALASRANANWAVATYVPGSVLLAAWLIARGRERWLAVAVGVNATLGLAGLVMAAALSFGGVGPAAGLRAVDAVSGWARLGTAVRAILDRHPDAVLASDDRMLFTELSYYARVPTGRGFAFDSNGRVDNHFELTRPLTREAGRRAVLATLDPDPRHFTAAFETLESLGTVEIELPSGRARRVGLYLGTGFLGGEGGAASRSRAVLHGSEEWSMASAGEAALHVDADIGAGPDRVDRERGR